jgi:hypothetical protein
LALLLAPGLSGLDQGHGEDRSEIFVTLDLAPNIPDQAAQAGAQELDPPAHALELFGMYERRTLLVRARREWTYRHHGGDLGDAAIGLAQGYAVLLGQLAQLPDHHQKKLGIAMVAPVEVVSCPPITVPGNS